MQIVKRIPYWGAVVLLAYMPFHIFFSQSVSTITGGLEAWKVAKDIFTAVLAMFTICLVIFNRGVPKWFWTLLGVSGAYFLLHVLLWMIHPHLFHTSAEVGFIYNMRLICYVLIGAGAALLYPRMFAFRSIFKVIIAVSSVVAILAVIQYFLPKDILTHFGYSLARAARPSFFIDDNPAFPRVMSTLRDPNSLGAYLLVPIALLTHALLQAKKSSGRRRVWLAGLMVLHVTALYMTFSRSAWLGAVVMTGAIIWWRFSSYFVRVIRQWWLAGVVVLLLLAGGLFALRHNTQLDGIVSHSTATQVGPHDSNDLHLIYIKKGLSGIWHNPLGHGPGTAGLASIQNPDGGLLTENYYVQIGYEVGVLGLGIFVGLLVWLYIRLWRRHDEWTTVLLSTFWAYALINMLLHMWSNEAVAVQWWLLAGVALALPAATKRSGRSDATKARADA